MKRISIVVPAYNEERNIEPLLERLDKVFHSLDDTESEIIIVDDASRDNTALRLKALSEKYTNLKSIHLAKNCGSHIAITCGLHHASGDAAIVLAADLQDPPEDIPRLLAEWDKGAKVVWAERKRREGEKRSTLFFARIYYYIIRNWVGVTNMPVGGADFFLVDQDVLNSLKRFTESHVSVTVLISWMGYKQATIEYCKKSRLHGTSGWNFDKKIKLFIDSIISFSAFPIRVMTYIGLIFSFLGFGYAGMIIIMTLSGLRTVPGWSSIIVVVLIMGGIQMIMMGILGEYVWRNLDEARRRPRYLIQSAKGIENINYGLHATSASRTELPQ